MRDSNEGMIEIVGSQKNDSSYFSIIRLVWNSKDYTLKFGIVEEDYLNIKNIISFRPFENTGFSAYSYFFSGSYQKDHPTKGDSTMSVKVEQQNKSKQYYFKISTGYIANLIWFKQVDDQAILEQFKV